jgi:type III pantothenate kinase
LLDSLFNMNLVVEIGSHQIKAALFEGDKLVQASPFATPDLLLQAVKEKNLEAILVSSEDASKSREMTTVFTGYPCRILEVSDFHQLGTEETRSLLKPNRIANIFGALYHHPINDCIIVDFGTTVRFDYVSKQGRYLGGALFPDFDGIFQLLEKAKFPEVADQSPSALGKAQFEQSKSGSYFGLLGAVERIVAELRLSSETPSGVMTVATGTATASPALQKELHDFIETVDPHLTLIGLNQILKEGKK